MFNFSPQKTLSKATLSKATLSKATLSKATLSKATLSKATLSKATLSKATWSLQATTYGFQKPIKSLYFKLVWLNVSKKFFKTKLLLNF